MARILGLFLIGGTIGAAAAVMGFHASDWQFWAWCAPTLLGIQLITPQGD